MENQIESFEDLIIWQDSMNLCSDLFQALHNCREYGLRDHVLKSAVSVPSNIAEGAERETNKEFIRFLYYAKGSAGELRTQLYIVKRQNLIAPEKCLDYIDQAKKIAAMTQNLIKRRKKMMLHNTIKQILTIFNL